MHNVDSVLRDYLHSTDDDERKRLEGELLQTYAVPLIRRTLRQRLGFYVDQSGRNSNYPDAADLFQDVQLSLLQKLNELHSQQNTNHIGNFGHYVVRVAINSCNEYLRHKTPERSSLNHNLRDLMSRHRDFGIWKVKTKHSCADSPPGRNKGQLPSSQSRPKNRTRSLKPSAKLD